jgi:hypothetical protein
MCASTEGQSVRYRTYEAMAVFARRSQGGAAGL